MELTCLLSSHRYSPSTKNLTHRFLLGSFFHYCPISTAISCCSPSLIQPSGTGEAIHRSALAVSAISGLEIIEDAIRCFNCGSYNHSLRECPRPHDNVAVNIARRQRKSQRNHNATRYFQNFPAGKYDGLRQGSLDDVTRQALGLGELDPPPWLNRMREIGYPPRYIDVDAEDQPSGITIYTDAEIAEQEDGEIMKKQRSVSDP